MLFQNLVNDALRVALVLGLALAAVRLLRRRTPATRRVVLATALAGALVMPLVSAVAPAWRLPAPVESVGIRARELTESIVDATPGAAPAAAAASTDEPAAPAPEHARLRLDWRAGVAIVWALGALRVLSRVAVGLLRLRKIVARSTPALAWTAAVARAGRETGTVADVRVSGAVEAPAVAGLVRPIVLVPPSSHAWTDERRHAVLLHELAHVRQRDCLVNLVAQVACALHWFDPLAWIAARRLRVERELAADEAVLASGQKASRYAEDLVAIASSAWEAPAGALGMGERSQLSVRVAAILSRRSAAGVLSRAQAVALGGTGALVVGAVACTAAVTSAPGGSTGGAAPSPGEAWSAAAGSTVRPAIQAIADEELDRALAESHAREAAILVLDPSTGEILADAGKEGGARADVAVASAFVTGSTIKAMTLAAALDEGVVSPGDRFDCEHGAWTYQGQVVHDSHALGVLGLPDMLAVSTNIGFTKVFDRLGGARLDRWLRAFHLGSAPAVDGAVAGTLPERTEDHSYRGAVTAIGEGATASPLQVAAAYAAIANGGEYVAPTRTRREGPPSRERIMKPETARQVTAMLENVVASDVGTGKRARVEGFRVAGKTGTAEWDQPDGGAAIYASFVGFVPADAPRFVIIVGIGEPRGEDANGPSLAAPVFSRVAARALATR